jgi:thymidylate synthase (FAD)
MEVKLLVYTQRPLEVLYTAFRSCYSNKTPQKIWEEVLSGKISQEKMAEFIEEVLSTGHASPLEHISFTFAISGISRALSHQLVRHRIGISFSQQSQRYVEFKEGKFPYVLPESVKRSGLENKFRKHMERSGRLYEELLKAGVKKEDARFVIPNACTTNFELTLNFQSLLHICDLRLCTRAQWEIREMVAKMKAEVTRVCPLLGRKLQPQCGEGRLGYCPEKFSEYEKCPLSKTRPHKTQLNL